MYGLRGHLAHSVYIPARVINVHILYYSKNNDIVIFIMYTALASLLSIYTYVYIHTPEWFHKQQLLL